MNFQPSQDRVVIDPIESKKVTAGGIHLPDNAREKPIKGKILAVGPDAVKGQNTTDLHKVGDIVLYHPLSGTPVEIEGQEVIILRSGDVFGTI